MRLTTRTNLAMRTLMVCAVNPGRIIRKHEVAESCNASENHLAQVIHLLAQRGFLRTVRGRAGGLLLGRPAAEITVGAVFRSFEAVLPFTECFAGAENACPLVGACRLKCVISDALKAFYDHLDTVTLSDLVAENGDLERLLKVA
ncbi:MAG: Rrf2 family transcriptional regulator [Rhodobacteraceae bacterium PARR1]|nr:MAG: Rrf2 family transcriptional regulator [Rhodobacteraceae bacterium PARR1]